jgi:hypothetical protein
MLQYTQKIYDFLYINVPEGILGKCLDPGIQETGPEKSVYGR